MQKVTIINPHENAFETLRNIYIMPRYGTIAVATALKNIGYEVRVYSEFIRSRIDWDWVYQADFICIALMSFAARRGYQMAREIKQHTDAPIIFGGAHPTILPEDCLKYADYVVRNEGEVTLTALLAALNNGGDLGRIKGISYKTASGEIKHNPRREFIDNLDIPQDVSLLREYAEVGKDIDKKILMHMQVIQTSRGCPFNCKFCVTPRELGTKYRTKSIATVLQDMKDSMAITKSNNFIIVDNEFTLKRKRTRELLLAMIDRFQGALKLSLFARISVAREPEILELMKRAGINLLILGIESTNEETLKYFKKGQTPAEIKECVDIIHEAGLRTMGSTIVGSDYDTPETIRRQADFLIDNNFYHATFYPLYDFPTKEKVLGLPQLFPDNRFIHHDWRFYNSKYVTHYPMRMKPSTLQKAIIDSYQLFYSLKRLKGREYGRVGYKLFLVNPEIRLTREYIPFLEEFEEGLYDENERLIEKNLPLDGGDLTKRRHIPIDLSKI